MQKTMLLMAALVLSLFISGCGGGTSTTVVGSTTDTLTASDIYKKTLHVTSPLGAPYTTFHTYSGVTKYDWNNDPADSNTRLGTWSVSAADHSVTFSDLASPTPTIIKKVTGIQKEYLDTAKTVVNYWLVTDDSTQKNCRMYVDSQASTSTFGTYTSSNAARYGLMGGAIQKTTLPSTFSNVATVTGITGTSGFLDDSSNTPAQFGKPLGITTTDGKTFFVLDNSNNAVRMVYPENGVMKVRTVPLKDSSGTTVTLNSPTDITTDGTYLYVADTNNFVIRKITLAFDSNGENPTGTIITLAGTGISGSIDGTGNTLTTTGTARFTAPIGITTDGTNLYVTDNEAIRKVVISTGDVTTLAGSPGSSGSTDGTGTAARFNFPDRITTDGTNLYVTDVKNYTIRKVVIASGVVTKIAGIVGTSGSLDAAGASASATFSGPAGITTDGTYLYVTDWGEVVYGNPVVGQTIRRVTISDGTVTTIAGVSGHVNIRDGNGNLPDSGATTSAQDVYFYCPAGITTDGTSLFVADAFNYTIRRIYKQ